MSNYENLSRQEAIEKIKELADDIKICMFCSSGDKEELLDTRPMAVQRVDEDGTIWFFSGISSNKNREIKLNDRVQLIFSDPDDMKFMTLYGNSNEVHDQNKIDELWNPMVKAWFKGGKDDPNLTLISFQPNEGYYWDTENGKMVSFLKIAASAITRKSKDDSVEGLLNI